MTSTRSGLPLFTDRKEQDGMSATEVKEVKTELWADCPDSEDAWFRNQAARLEVYRSDDNEIAVAVEALIDEDERDRVLTFYLTDAEATRLAFVIGKEVLER